jgi:hypothetical protein
MTLKIDFCKVTKLDRFAIAVVVLAFLSLGWGHLTRPAAPKGYRPGDPMSISGLPSGVESGTRLVVWLDSDCGPCVESAQFYKALTDLPHRLPIVIASSEQQDHLEKFVKDNMLHPDAVLSTAGRRYEFAGTPTLLVLDAKNTVQKVWYGKRANPKEEMAVIDQVRR